jgi:riboflavin-specific deaminase-like protein
MNCELTISIKEPSRVACLARRQRVLSWLLLSCLLLHDSVGFSIENFRTQKTSIQRVSLYQRVHSRKNSQVSDEQNKAWFFASRRCDTSLFTAKHPQVSGVTLKIAVDANGCAGESCNDQSKTQSSDKNTPSVRFTSPSSLDMVHRLRNDSDAVLVGRGTVVADNPSLTVRRNVTCHKQPLRVILDPSLCLLHDKSNFDHFQLFNDGQRTNIYHCVKEDDPRLAYLNVPESLDCVYIEPSLSSPNTLNLTQVLAHLNHNDVQHVMVEGGPATAKRFLDERLVDRALIVRSPRICFSNPATSIPAGMDAPRLQQAGLEFLGSVWSEGDIIECWSRPGLPWPTKQVGDWP